MINYLRSIFGRLGLEGNTVEWAAVAVALGAILLVSLAAYGITRQWIIALIRRAIAHTKTTWDDLLTRWRVFHKASHLVPGVVIYSLVPVVFAEHPTLVSVLTRAAIIYMLVAGVFVLDAVLNAALGIYGTFRVSKQVPIKGFVQVLKIVIYFFGGILVLSILLGQSPLYFLSGMGALTAVLMLVFKDPILGFVAGIQLSSNNMVAVGDWIEMPKYGADGDVLEVALTTVKVQNWDKTITTIPTYALISDSFKNWRGMSESGGRRIKRSIMIDLQTIRFCDEAMLKRYARIAFIADYLEAKKKELQAYNRKLKVDLAALANGRRLTNVGTFRAYVVAYLRHHPMINQEMTFLVRQLEPTQHGLPLQIYVFSKDKVWANYEAIQADIFDHILAVAPEFDLRVYQAPSGNDLRHLNAFTPPKSPAWPKPTKPRPPAKTPVRRRKA